MTSFDNHGTTCNVYVYTYISLSLKSLTRFPYPKTTRMRELEMLKRKRFYGSKEGESGHEASCAGSSGHQRLSDDSGGEPLVVVSSVGVGDVGTNRRESGVSSSPPESPGRQVSDDKTSMDGGSGYKVSSVPLW